MKISFEMLKSCINVASQNFKSGNWSENNVIAYCAVHGINSASSKVLIERVQNVIAINYIDNEYQQSIDGDIIEAYRNVKKGFNKQDGKDLKFCQYCPSCMSLICYIFVS